MATSKKWKMAWEPLDVVPPSYDKSIYCKTEPVYEESVVNGVKVLTQTGTTDVYEKIQSYKGVCDMNQIIQRASLGLIDISDTGMTYGDSTLIPNDIMESLQMKAKAQENVEQVVSKLDPSVKEKFGSTAEEIINNFNLDDFKDYLKSKVVKEEKEKTE